MTCSPTCEKIMSARKFRCGFFAFETLLRAILGWLTAKCRKCERCPNAALPAEKLLNSCNGSKGLPSSWRVATAFRGAVEGLETEQT